MCLVCSGGSSSRVNSLFCVVSSSDRWSSDLSSLSRSDSNNSCVNGAGNTVVQLVVHLWDWVLVVDGSLRKISDSSGLNHVSDGHSLDGLVLRNTSGTVDTSNWLDVSSTLLVSSVGCSLLRHFNLM